MVQDYGNYILKRFKWFQYNCSFSGMFFYKVVFLTGQHPLFAGYLIRINQIEESVRGQYLNLFLDSHVARQHGNRVKTDGVNQSNINGEKLQNYPLPLCSIAEQDEIIRVLEERLSIVERMEQEIDDQLALSRTMRQSVLKRAFSGRFVKQDPSDDNHHRCQEPAHYWQKRQDRTVCNKQEQAKNAAGAQN